MLLGEDAENILLESKAAVFGVGGVGGHCVDALVRCGLGRIAIFDSAKVKPSNLNRQICAKKSTVGMKKVEAMSLHIADVSDCITEAFDCFVTRENAEELIPADADIIIDAVDNVTAKISLIEAASRWVRATDLSRTKFALRISLKQASTRFPALCAENCASAV